MALLCVAFVAESATGSLIMLEARTEGSNRAAAEMAPDTLSASGVMLPMGSAMALPPCSATPLVPVHRSSDVTWYR